MPYGYESLEPTIDARTVELHYNNHHKPAATAVNRAEGELAKARDGGQFALVKHHEKELAYQRPEYVSNLFNIINWNKVAERYASARA